MPRSTSQAAAESAAGRPRHDAILGDRHAAAVTPAELQDVLLEQGYSGGRQKQRLKELLTDLASREDAERTPEERRLIETIETALRETGGAPKADRS